MAAPDQSRGDEGRFRVDPKIWVDEMRNPEAYRFDPTPSCRSTAVCSRGATRRRASSRGFMMKLADSLRSGEWWTFRRRARRR